MDNSALLNVFQEYASFGSTFQVNELANNLWIKMLKETGVINKGFTVTDADLVFASVRGNEGPKKITFRQFVDALSKVASRKRMGVAEIITTLCGSNGPKSSGTAAATGGIYGKLTDVSQYTGAHKERFNADGTGRGAAGRTQYTNGVGDLSQITRPNLGGRIGGPNPNTMKAPAANGRRGSNASTSSQSSASNSPGLSPANSRSPSPAGRRRTGTTTITEDDLEKPERHISSKGKATRKLGDNDGSPQLHDIFEAYCGRAVDMDGARFAKLVADAGLFCKLFKKTDVDVIFAKAKYTGERRIPFPEFQTALTLIAERKGIHPDKVRDLVRTQAGVDGPKLNGPATKTRGNIFDKLTDTSQYTGAHKARFDAHGRGLGALGRDMHVGPGKIGDLSALTRPNF